MIEQVVEAVRSAIAEVDESNGLISEVVDLLGEVAPKMIRATELHLELKYGYLNADDLGGVLHVLEELNL